MAKKNDAKWAVDGKDMNLDELSNRFVKEYLSKFNPQIPEKDEKVTISLSEMILAKLIYVALDRAKERKIKGDFGKATFIVGYLSNKIPLDDLHIEFKKNKSEKTKYTKKA